MLVKMVKIPIRSSYIFIRYEENEELYRMLNRGNYKNITIKRRVVLFLRDRQVVYGILKV